MLFATILSLLAGSAQPMPHPDRPPAITLEVIENGPTITVLLKGHSQIEQRVSYKVTLEGGSTSTHSGGSTLAANRSTILSTLKMTARQPWCVRAWVTEEDGTSYAYTEGDCR